MMKLSDKLGKRVLLAIAALALICVLAMAPPAAAQGCSMCYANAQQQQAEQARALNLGIIFLLVPSILVFAGVMITAARRREDSTTPDV